MKTLILCVGFYSLGVFNCAIFAAVYLLHRPRYVAPTKHCRMNRGEPVAGAPQEKPVEPLYMYGVTGEER
jgi:hypothetical protein